MGNGATAGVATEYDGQWEGHDNQNQPVSWVVREGRVEGFTLGIRASFAGYSCRGQTVQADPAPIAASVASVDADMPNAGLPISATITFDSTATAHGATGELYANGLFCQDPLLISFGTGDSRIVPVYEFVAQKVDAGGGSTGGAGGASAGGGSGPSIGEAGAAQAGAPNVPPGLGEAGASLGGGFGE